MEFRHFSIFFIGIIRPSHPSKYYDVRRIFLHECGTTENTAVSSFLGGWWLCGLWVVGCGLWVVASR